MERSRGRQGPAGLGAEAGECLLALEAVRMEHHFPSSLPRASQSGGEMRNACCCFRSTSKQALAALQLRLLQ